jgi:membrane protein implicated in regulation of membrane protease activity
MVFSPAILWFVAGTLLCLVEVILPTAFTAFAMGASALLVALVAWLLPKWVGLQILLWMVFSTTFVYLTHRLMPKRRVIAIEDATEAQTLTEILPGQTGRVLYEGNSWRARCEDEKVAIASDQKVYVIGRKGTTLIVMPEHSVHFEI